MEEQEFIDLWNQEGASTYLYCCQDNEMKIRKVHDPKVCLECSRFVLKGGECDPL